MSKSRFPRLASQVALLTVALVLGQVGIAQAKATPMHIMEGYLPLGWCLLWFAAAVPFWVVGLIQMRKLLIEQPEKRTLLGLAGAFTFVLSALKIPSVSGSSSHPTGTGFGAILFGPFISAILGSIVLLFQALLLAHGGLSTLGANSVSMAVVGPLVAWGIWLLLKDRAPRAFTIFLAAALADLMTYVVTSVQLALAYPDPVSGFMGSFVKFGVIFAVTQIPLAISEGILTVLIFNALANRMGEPAMLFESKGAAS